MESSGKPAGRSSSVPGSPRTELVLHKGRQAGKSRILEGDVVLLGRAQGCDVRLSADGIAARHCLLARTPGGWMVRDLGTATGTHVEGQRVSVSLLKDGDLLGVGPVEFRFRVQSTPAENQPTDLDAGLRIQAAAVAAQQAALDEEEARLEQRRATLQNQESQLAALLEEKRRDLEILREQVQTGGDASTGEGSPAQEAARSALVVAQRIALEEQAKIERERRRLVALNRRLRRRWHRYWLAERRRLDRDRQVLLEEAARLQEDQAAQQSREDAFQEKKLRFAAVYELGRRRLRESFAKLHEDRRRWKHRRGCERAALKVRCFDIEQSERRLVRAQEMFLREKRSWDEARTLLVEELQGLRRRRDNLYRKLSALAAEQEPVPFLDPEIVEESGQGFLGSNPDASVRNDSGGEPIVVEPEAAPSVPTPPSGALVLRASSADRGEAEDRSLLVVEAWYRLAAVQKDWERRRMADLEELHSVACRLEEESATLARRDEEQQALDQTLRKRHEEMVRFRGRLIAWRARLQVEEHAWQGERERLLDMTQRRLAQGEKQQKLLNEMRLRWNERRKGELEDLRQQKNRLLEEARKLLDLREKLEQARAGLEDEKRQFNERSLALEQLRQDIFRQTDPVTAKRRLERFRRRWITQQAEALRRLQQERAALPDDFAVLRQLSEQVEKLDREASGRHVEMSEKWSAWEHQELLAGTRRSRIEAELHQSEIQMRLTRQQLDKTREEVERIARALLAEPDAPASSLQSAA